MEYVEVVKGFLRIGLMQSKRVMADEIGDLELDRVPKKSLKPDMDCPICGNPFLEGKFSKVSYSINR